MKKLILITCLIFAAYHSASAQSRTKKVRYGTTTSNIYSKIFHIHFPKDSSATTLNAYMIGLGNPVTFIIKVKKGRLITATVKEMGDPGNIRINQIVTPGGKSDGPFSKTFQYPIKRKGTYKIVVGGSNMQGDDWKGAFTMRVSVT